MMPDFPSKRILSLLAISISLAACEPNEMYPAGGIPFSGSNSGGSSAPAQQAAPTQRLAPMPIEDPEEEANAMGNNAQNGRIVIARSASHAQSRCAQYAGTRRTAMPEALGNDRWRCRYY
jgi:hypothetical protein